MTARTCSFSNTPKQEGWVLIIGMVVLVMLTIIAMGVMRTTIQEEKMAGISRDMNISFESAEIGLREAEAFIENPVARVFLMKLRTVSTLRAPLMNILSPHPSEQNGTTTTP